MIHYVRWFWQQSAGVRGRLLLRITAGLMQVGLGLLLVWLSRRFIDVAVWTDRVSEETAILLAVVALLVLTRQTVYYLTQTTDTLLQNVVRQRLFQKVLRRRLFAGNGDTLHSGDVCQRLEQDVTTVTGIVVETIPGMAVTLVQLACAFLLMHFFDAWLAWSLLLTTPIVIACAKYLAHRLKQMTLDIRQEETSIQKTIQESAEQGVTIKVLQGEGIMMERLRHLQKRLAALVYRRVRFTLASRLLLGLSFGFGYFGAFAYGGIQLRNGIITVGVLTAFLQLVSQIQGPIMTLLGMIPQLIHSAASVDRIEEVEQLEQECPAPPAAAPDHHGGIGISMEHVSFGYRQGAASVLSDYSHDFKPGTSTALLGETGQGKTTVLRLISGILTPQEGTVSLYDTQGHQMTGTAMRQHIVYISQGNTLFGGTIRDNLLLANPNATDEALCHALHTAVADFVFRLPQGIDTVVGEHAACLSEGQAQRIAIARGLLREGTVMLLDEISSALDVETEMTLFQRLTDSFPNRTIVCVTHRPEAAKSCQYVIRLSH